MKGQLCFVEAIEAPKSNVFKSIINERVANYGVETLQDEEFISVLTGIPIEKCREFIEQYGLIDLIKNMEALDITVTQKRKLSLLYGCCNRISTSAVKEKYKIDSSTKAGEYFVGDLKFCKIEIFKTMLLDNQNRIISVDTVSKGCVNEAPIYIRNIIQNALNKNAVSIIFAHPHPGGSLQPSSADIDITKKLVNACRLVQINVMDHIIVADSRFTSFAEKGLL